MMKKLVVAGLVALSPLTAQAADTGPGCGWGSMVFEGQNGVAPHVLAATTNGTYTQTFGMTTGTAGCDTSQSISYMAFNFLDSNMEKVARDMAVGEGENLTTLAVLMGIDEQHRPTFYQSTKDNFSKIFSGENVRSREVYRSIVSIMKENNKLAQYAG